MLGDVGIGGLHQIDQGGHTRRLQVRDLLSDAHAPLAARRNVRAVEARSDDRGTGNALLLTRPGADRQAPFHDVEQGEFLEQVGTRDNAIDAGHGERFDEPIEQLAAVDDLAGAWIGRMIARQQHQLAVDGHRVVASTTGLQSGCYDVRPADPVGDDTRPTGIVKPIGTHVPEVTTGLNPARGPVPATLRIMVMWRESNSSDAVRRAPNAGRVPRTIAALVAVLGLLLAIAPNAWAHAELRQASPRVGSVVGGEFHSISLQFSGLDTEADFRAELLDPSGTPIGGKAVREEMRIVIPIEPLEVPGVYTVSYTTIGVDEDLVSDTYTFRYDPSAPEPEGITIEITTVERVGWFGYALLLVGAALLGYLAHRFRFAYREHRAAQQAA